MEKLIWRIAPKSLKRKFTHLVKSQVRENNRNESSRIPKYTLKKENLQNAKLLLDRQELLELLPKNAKVAELGVDEGGFSERIVTTCTPAELHLVDFWGSDRYNQNKRKAVEDRFHSQRESGQVSIHLGLSTEVVHSFEDGYFDWVYIDTDHKYKTTIQELELWSKKVKSGGILAGHDYITGNWNNIVRYGVIEAVYEFCHKYNWEIIYITAELDNHPSFAIRQIQAI